MLFTNVRGDVVFVDRNFLLLTKRSPDELVVGKPFYSLLGIDAQSATHWLRDLMQQGFAVRRPASLTTNTGTLRPALATGVAAYAERMSFIGADILLTLPSLDYRLPTQSIRHTDVMSTYLQQAVLDARLTKSRTFLQVYVVAQIDALQILLGRMSGLQIRDRLEQILNETARGQGIPALMRNGYLEFTHKTTNLGAYGSLLRAAVGYSVNVLGKRLVAAEIRAIPIDPQLVEVVTQLDLQGLLED